MLIQSRYSLLLILISLTLAGCTYKSKGKPMLPQSGSTMADIYRAHMQEVGQSQLTQPRFNVYVDRDAMYSGYTQDALQELDQLFPVLPNPTLVMYVHPHLAGDEMSPVPGYYTSFTLYERTHYALPGEVKPRLKHSYQKP